MGYAMDERKLFSSLLKIAKVRLVKWEMVRNFKALPRQYEEMGGNHGGRTQSNTTNTTKQPLKIECGWSF